MRCTAAAREEEEAARAYDAAARRLRGEKAHGGAHGGGRWRLNFPTEAEAAAADEEPADQEAAAGAEATVAQRKAAGQPSSPYAGVCWDKKQRRWVAPVP